MLCHLYRCLPRRLRGTVLGCLVGECDHYPAQRRAAAGIIFNATEANLKYLEPPARSFYVGLRFCAEPQGRLSVGNVVS